MSARIAPRFTRDIDLVVAVSGDKQAETLVRELLGRGYSLVALVEQEAVGRLATVRLLPPGEPTDGVVVDLLFASSGIEPEIVRDAEPVELLDGLVVPLARSGHLLAQKVLSRNDRTRPQDLADGHALLKEASPEELDLARRALELIEQRGFQRDKDLLAEFDDLLKMSSKRSESG